MNIVGELINASRKNIKEAIEAGNSDLIREIAKSQADSGADYIDINAGIFIKKEVEYMKWMVPLVQEVVDKPCCLDSPNPKAIEAALSVHKGTAMINSISLEKDRYEKLLPVVSGTDLKVIALCMSDQKMPETADDRLAIADTLINMLQQHHIALENIYVDPLVQPVSARDDFGCQFLKAIEKITETFPGIHTICGLSNISYGLPNRMFLNQTFMVMSIAKGLDSAILNPLDRHMMANIVAAEALLGKDSYCGNYLDAHRNGMFDL